MRSVFKRKSDIKLSEEGPFPARTLLSKDETPSVSVKIGKLPIGREIAIHMHEHSDQLEYYIKGRATLFLEGIGEKEIKPDTFMFAPKGVKHGIRNVTEELVIISVFIPALF